MFRKTAAVMVLIILLSFNACGDGGVFRDDSQNADARLEQVIEAVENHDKEVLRAMFSKQALDEAEDLDGRMDYLFDFVQGDIKSWERNAGGVGATKSKGHIKKKYRYWYTVKTDKEDYLFFLLEYPEDTEHPENVGLYMLQVIKAEDRDTQFDGGQDILCPGIYRPPVTVDSEDAINTNQSQDENDNVTNEAIDKNESKYLNLASDMHLADIELDEDRSRIIEEYGEPQEINEDDYTYISMTYDFAEITCINDSNKPDSSESVISIRSNKLGVEGPRGLKIGDNVNLVSQYFGFEKDIDFSITGESIDVYNEQKPEGNFFARVDYSDKPNEGSIVICAYDIYATRINYKEGKITKLEVFEQQ